MYTINITGHHVDVTPAIKDHINEKMQKVSTSFGAYPPPCERLHHKVIYAIGTADRLSKVPWCFQRDPMLPATQRGAAS